MVSFCQREPVPALLDELIMYTCVCYRPLMNEVNPLALRENNTHIKVNRTETPDPGSYGKYAIPLKMLNYHQHF